jgi:hypothetical protein
MWVDRRRSLVSQIAIPHETLCDVPLFTGCAGDGQFAPQAAADQF